MATGIAPIETPQGVKMLPTNIPLTASDEIKGQILGSGNSVRWSGSASCNRVTRTSRMSSCNPPTTGWFSGSSHKGSLLLTVGRSRKLHSGGGEDVAHSRVLAPQGLFPAV